MVDQRREVEDAKTTTAWRRDIVRSSRYTREPRCEVYLPVSGREGNEIRCERGQDGESRRGLREVSILGRVSHSCLDEECELTIFRLGTGTFAEVRKAVDVETGDLRAIKVGHKISTYKRQ